MVWSPGADFYSYFLYPKIAFSIFGASFKTKILVGQWLGQQTSWPPAVRVRCAVNCSPIALGAGSDLAGSTSGKAD